MKLMKVATLAALASVVTPAFASGGGATFDVGPAVAAIAGLGVGIAAIGGAKMLPAAIAVGWKWLKATIFG